MTKQENKKKVNSRYYFRKNNYDKGYELEERLLEDASREFKNDNDGNYPGPRSCANILENFFHFLQIATVDGSDSFAYKNVPVSFYHDGIYIVDDEMIGRLVNHLNPNITDNGLRNIIRWLRLDAKRVHANNNPNLVAVANGVYDYRDKKLHEFNPKKYVFVSKIATAYIDNPKKPEINGFDIDKWLDEDICENDPEKKLLLWQAFAAIVNPNKNHKSALLLLDNGQGNTGKGTLQDLMTNLVGIEHRAALKLKDFQDDARVASAYGSSLIIGDDNTPDDFIKDSSTLKSVISGDSISINDKYEKAYTATIKAFVVQSMNGMPRFRDQSGALIDRFRVLFFKKRYEGSNLNPKVKSDYIKRPSVLQYVLYKALQVKDFKRLVNTTESKEILGENLADNDPIQAFINNHIEEFKFSKCIPTDALFQTFLAVSDYENNKQNMNQTTFTKRVKPLMLDKGWFFSKNSKRPAQCGWSESDHDYLSKKYDQNYRYTYTIDASRQQGLFFKE